MCGEQQKDQLKEMDWKTLGGTESTEPNVGPAVKKRLPKKIRKVVKENKFVRLSPKHNST